MSRDEGHADQQLRRLEEHAAFSERAIDQLSAEMAEINRRLLTLTNRLERMEHRIEKIAQAPESPADSEAAE